MLSANFNWKHKNTDVSEDAINIGKKIGISSAIVESLIQRGYDDEEKINSFLNPQLSDLRDPFLLHDMKKACDRIKTAIENNEKITVYGDYDADGITSTSVMYETLQNLGANVDYFVPNRFTDGYGPNPDVYKRLINDGTNLVVTVDNGVSGNESVAVANELGCDVIITDHHELPDKLPDAYAIVHARYPGDEYPFGEFSGVGIAFKVATALLDEVPEEYLDLAAIGTVADLVSLTDENRILVKYGLQMIANTERPGLYSLGKLAGLKGELNEESISFGLAPRLNALGRMGDASSGVELLTTFDDEKADALAHDTEEQNKRRRKFVEDITTEAVIQAQTQNDDAVQVVYGQNWHEGVVGIVASRLVEKFQKPSLVLNLDSNTGILKGSGRSVEGFNLFDALNGVRDKMISFGGHAMAVGLSVDEEHINEISQHLNEYAKTHKLDANAKSDLLISGRLKCEDVNEELFNQLQLLAPFGTDNEYPVFEFSPNMVTNIQTMGKDNSHLKFQMVDKQGKVNVLAFKHGSQANDLINNCDNVLVAGHLDKNTWRGKTTIQIMLDDMRSSGIEIIDKRTHVLAKEMFKPTGNYIFFSEKLYKKLSPFVNNNSTSSLYSNLSSQDKFDNILIVDCPNDVSHLEDALSKISFNSVTFYLFKNHYIFKKGMPNRTQYAKLFKFIKTHNDIQIHDKINKIGSYLDIDVQTLIFMINVFNDLNFVYIENGIMNYNPDLVNTALTESRVYQDREKQIETEKKLLAVSGEKFKQNVRICLDK
ncbi:single-stranded-DNA-specific exonuclease RecJ [Apilactobacillus bombintestini]|uniref:Single-stranded-DNA-specific exonuclease RecJ n=1 Tax=Apilactobacillus bombintestini TaxID=2419772 RepID=A0A387ARC9_9LACO|nr:single-stranded-DNA-specific exonuclease RecJ [Apilactobacillus bombintestini]AYF92477.1 single-stranded-DNA-specific exonuclease RecJ [Apilactobacillus bombintestini]